MFACSLNQISDVYPPEVDSMALWDTILLSLKEHVFHVAGVQ